MFLVFKYVRSTCIEIEVCECETVEEAIKTVIALNRIKWNRDTLYDYISIANYSPQ